MYNPNFSEKMREMRIAELEKQIREINTIANDYYLKQQKEIFAALYEKSTAYIRIVIFGAYAGIFVLWQIIKEYMSSTITSWIGLLIGTSLMLFVTMEVYKMIESTFFLKNLDKIICKFPEKERLQKWQIAFSIRAAREFRIFFYFLIPTVITGFSASIILILQFLKDLFKT